jgi:hypothetical protein
MEQSPLHEHLEAEIHELAREAARELPGGDMNREAIHSVLERKLYAPGSEFPATPSLGRKGNENPAADTSSLPSYAGTLPADAKLRAEELLDLAWHRGIAHAIREAKRSDPLIMDLFHDAIVERLYQAFRARGIVK